MFKFGKYTRYNVGIIIDKGDSQTVKTWYSIKTDNYVYMVGENSIEGIYSEPTEK